MNTRKEGEKIEKTNQRHIICKKAKKDKLYICYINIPRQFRITKVISKADEIVYFYVKSSDALFGSFEHPCQIAYYFHFTKSSFQSTRFSVNALGTIFKILILEFNKESIHKLLIIPGIDITILSILIYNNYKQTNENTFNVYLLSNKILSVV